jgi:cyclohexa-1,5-dienecarbonyl-CoA hydratase
VINEESAIRIEIDEGGAVLRIALARPKGNIIDGRMLDEIRAALDRHATNPRTKAIVFEGQGPSFSYGASIEEHQKHLVREMLAKLHRTLRRLGELGVPTIAVVRGQCLGGGLELAAFCTWIFASEEATFGQPEIKLGVFAPVASVLLPWRLGGGPALDLLISGRSISGREGKEIGLVHEVCSDPSEAARRFIAAHLLPKSASSLRFAERAARSSLASAFDHALEELERVYLEELMNTDDANEGIRAFIERRSPAFGVTEGGRP